MIKIKQSIRTFISLLLIYSVGTTPLLHAKQDAQPEKISLYQQIGNEYLTTSEIKESYTTPNDAKAPRAWYEKLVPEEVAKKIYPQLKLTLLSEGQRKEFLFNKLVDNTQPNNVLVNSAWFDLELYKHSNFVKSIKRTRTTAGDVVLTKMISQPTSDAAHARINQAIVKKLVDDPILLDSLDKELQRIGENEALYYAVIKDDNIEEANKLIQLVNPMPFSRSAKSTIGQEIGTATNQISSAITTALIDFFALYNGVKIFQKTTGLNVPGIKHVDAGLIHACAKLGVVGLKATSKVQGNKFTEGDKALADIKGAYNSFTLPAYVNAIILGVILLISPQMNVMTRNAIVSIPKYLQTKLHAAGKTISAYKNINTIVNQDDIFKAGIYNFENFNELMTGQKGSKDFNNLIGKLDTWTFTGKPSAFSLTGRTLATTLLMLEKDVKEQLISLVETVGCIDAYVSMAKLYKEHQGTSTPYCFVEYAQSDTPYLSLVDFSNPLLGKNAIPNTIEFGGNSSRNMILTGQNTAGKSTILKAITYAIFLGKHLILLLRNAWYSLHLQSSIPT